MSGRAIDDGTVMPSRAAMPSVVPDRPGRDKVLMLAATVGRMGVGLLTFVLLARYLGPVQFGMIATAMAYATFVGIATDYGLATSALRTASAQPGAAGRIVGDALAVKAMLSMLVAAFGGILLFALLPVPSVLVYALVFIGVIAYSFADLSMVASRANRRFDIEAVLVLGSSIVMLVTVGGVAAYTRDVTMAAAAFMLTRLGYLIAVWIGLHRWLGHPARIRRDLRTMRETLRSSSSYAVDNILTTLASQIDVLMFGLILTHFEMGIYQAGSRLVQVIVPFAVVLSTVYLPRLVQAHHAASTAYGATARRMTLEFAGLATLFALAFTVIAPIATSMFYGPAYAPLHGLWGGFGAFVLLRLIASAFGIQLVALGEIRLRIASNVVAMAAFALATALLLPAYRLAAAPLLLAFSGVPSLVILGATVAMRGKDRAFSLGVVAFGLAAAGLAAGSMLLPAGGSGMFL